MNVKAVFSDHIDSWDTMANGMASLSHARLAVTQYFAKDCDGREEPITSLEVSAETSVDVVGKAAGYEPGETKGGAVHDLLSVDGHVSGLQGFCEAATEDLGLLRLDVDGETIYEAPAAATDY